MRALEMLEQQAESDGLLCRPRPPPEEPALDDTAPQEPTPTGKPWRSVTEADVQAALEGTLVGHMCRLMASVTEPTLPLSIALPKALALCGCALSQPREMNPVEAATAPWGIARAKFRINTAGGQACNIWTLIVAPSGTGKDIGNMPETIARTHKLCLGSSGSAEGIADALTQRGGGLLTIGEFGPFLDKTSWQSKASSFLTDAWSRGSFLVNLSTRTSGPPRESPYCYPSIIANIQPMTLRTFYNEVHLGSGFFARFLPSYCGKMKLLRPRPGGLGGLAAAQHIFNRFLAVSGEVEPPSNYLGDLVAEFENHGAQYPQIYGRLINEYGARFAAILAVDGNDGPVVLTDDIWRRAGVLVRWFFAQAEQIVDELSGTEYERRRESRLESFLEFIRRKGRCTRTQIAHQYSKNTNKEERNEILDELLDRGLIEIELVDGRPIIRPRLGPSKS